MCLNNVLHITYGLFILSNIIITQWRKVCQMGGFSCVYYVLAFAKINDAIMNMEIHH